MKTKLLLLLILAYPAHADYMSKFIQWGIASEHPGTSNLSSVKFLETGVAGEAGRMAYTVGVGGWADSSGYKVDNTTVWQANEVSNSAFVELLMGVMPRCEHGYITYKAGPAIITHTDVLLGSNIQIAHELGIGIRDSRDVRIGLVLKHFSNAGIVKPNQGRDFIGLRVEF